MGTQSAMRMSAETRLRMERALHSWPSLLHEGIRGAMVSVLGTKPTQTRSRSSSQYKHLIGECVPSSRSLLHQVFLFSIQPDNLILPDAQGEFSLMIHHRM